MNIPANRKGFSGWKLTKRPQDQDDVLLLPKPKSGRLRRGGNKAGRSRYESVPHYPIGPVPIQNSYKGQLGYGA